MKYINLSRNSIEFHDEFKTSVYPLNIVSYLVNASNVKFYSIQDSIYEKPLFSIELPFNLIDADGNEQTVTKDNIHEALKGLFDEDLTIQGQIDKLKEDVNEHVAESDVKFEYINNDIKSLESDIDDLKATDSDLYSKIAINQVAIAELNVEVDDLNDNLTSFKEDSIEKQTLLSASTEHNKEAIEELSLAVDAFKTETKDALDGVNDEIAALKAVDASLSQLAFNNANNIVEISAQTAVNTEKIKDNKELIDELFDSVDNVKQDVAENTTEISNINTTLDTLLHSKGVQDVIDTFKDVEDFLSGITDSKTLTELIHNAIAESEAKTSTEIASVDSKLTDSINTLSDELKGEIGALNDEFEAFSGDVYTKDEIDEKIDVVNAAIEGLDDDINAIDVDLSTKIEELSADTENKLNDVKNEFKADLETLSADVFTNIEDVDNRLDNKIDAIASDLEDKIEDVAENQNYVVVETLDDIEEPKEGMLAFCKSCTSPSTKGVAYTLNGEETEMPSVPLTKIFNFEVSKVDVETNEYASVTFHSESGSDVILTITKAKVCYMSYDGNRITLQVGREYKTTYDGVIYTYSYDGSKLTVSVDKPTVLYSANFVYYKETYATDYAKFTVYTFKNGIVYQYDGEKWNEFNDTYSKDEIDTMFEELVPSDLSNYYKKSETDALLFQKADKSDIVGVESEISQLQTAVTASNQAIEELSNEVEKKANKSDFDEYYNKSNVDTLLDGKTNNSDFNELSEKVATISADTKDAVSEGEMNDAINGAIANQKFKTINGNTIVGEGNIIISGGGESYDDTELRNKINDLSGKVETISADTVSEDEMNTAISSAITNQQFKTINGNSIKGSGNITVTTDLTNYYNKTEVDNKLNGKANTSTTYTKTEVDNKIAEVSKVRYEFDAETNTLNIITE